ncbi:hypothetical protein ABB37_08766 [Leptomonas pyrrhocoris]|uniref:Uncharacterized protein n=1 Tax=Leptomonas pyrrhocoris TaxID=157538 RepID=A0A0N0DRT1_LEPPY|nr:hypothetical protein ABB37_08766 [Leptomonas pyrrhocoris]KPA75088.1 hypothetical protein ABB37_08766 [Leptomonas pyrrhocoris]|eukprot:XP_015653527.1 hypothetical protein ABB37_08766 [Leptomonas pyrrhocoris]
MSHLFSRTYKAPPARMTRKAGVEATDAGIHVEEAPVTTRTCHSWSCYDQTADETVVVALHVHQSLHVEVVGAGGDGTGGSRCTTAQRSSSSSPSKSGGSPNNTTATTNDDGNPDNQEGLCGYTWELTWLPSPSQSGMNSSCPATPTSARFTFPRATPLAHSTVRGSGGVLFFSSRRVLIATEATENDGARTGTSALPHVLLDSFVVQRQPCAATTATTKGISSSASHQWRRVAGAVRLPCPLAAPFTPTAGPARATPLLVYGVQVPSTTASSSSTNGVQMRVLYVAAISTSISASNGRGSEQSVLVGVADLWETPDTPADPPAPLQCVPRHTVMESPLQLALSLPRPRNTHAPLSSSAAAALPLRPSDLLWVYVADVERNRWAGARGTQLYGSLVAVLPCLSDSALSASSAATSAGTSPLSRLLPAVPCSGFRAASLHGVLGVVSHELDVLAKEQALRQHRADRNSGGRSFAVDEEETVIAQLLPSSECSVCEVEIGPPVESVQAAASTAQLPPYTSVLLFVFDGVVARGSVHAKQGLYTTQTPPWNEAASAGAASVAVVHRVPLARTLWRGLTPVVPTSAKAAHPVYSAATGNTAAAPPAAYSTTNNADVMEDLFSWALTDLDRWAEFLAAGSSASHAVANTPRAGTCADAIADEREAGEEEEESIDAEGEMISSSPPSVATNTAVEFVAAATASVACCLPKRNALTSELKVWYYVSDGMGGPEIRAGTGATTSGVAALPVAAAPAAAAATAACLPAPGTEDWEAHVAEWTVSRCLHSPLASSTRAEDADAVAIVSTYKVLKMLWAHALLGTMGATHGPPPPPPAWPQVLMNVLHDTAADAGRHRTRLYVYARAVASLVSAGLASGSSGSSSGNSARREAELTHMRAAAVVFLRLVLRTLIELDWRAGDVDGRRCGQWMARWFLGEAAAVPQPRRSRSTVVAAAEEEESENESGTRTLLAEGRAMQVLMQLGASEEVLAWLRRMVLLYTCRCCQRPLELTLADVVAAAGVDLDAPGEEGKAAEESSRDGWSDSEDDGADEEARASPAGPLPRKAHSEADMAEWQASMEYALLRMARPAALHRLLHDLSCTTNSRFVTAAVAAAVPVKAVMLHGLLTVADLHSLVGVGWTAAQIHEAAPLGFSFVCLLVDVAMRVTTGTSASTAEGYETLVAAALDAWEGGECRGASAASSPGVRVPVYPLLSLCDSATATFPFPFSLLPPLLTVYVWYHVVDRLCRALKLLPQPLTEAGVRYGDEDEEDDEGLSVWSKRGGTDAPQLKGLHRGLCVLRCLTQDNPFCAEELFAAMQLVYPSCLEEHHGGVEDGGGSKESELTASPSWCAQFLAAWQHLLPLGAPPLSEQDAAATYRERCLARSPRFADLMRVLHLVYASAGSGHVLRAQLWRATAGPETASQQRETRSATAHTRSQAQLEHSLTTWLIDAAVRQANTATTALASQAGDRATLSSDLVAPWLIQLVAHVLLCDSAAVTDVGVHEQLYAALAQVRQKVSSATMGAAAAASAKVALALLRPCLMYAYPLLLQLALADELAGDPPIGDAVSAPASHGGTRNGTCEPTRERFLQFNEPLMWRGATGRSPDSPRQGRELEQLCAGEVCERARRLLGRIVGLYDAPMNTSLRTSSSSSSGGADRRFRVLALLLPLQPSVVDLAVRQRRLLRCSVEASQQQQHHVPPGTSTRTHASDDERAAFTAPPLDSTSSAITTETSRSSSSSTERVESGTEDALELAHFYLSSMAAYFMAASASLSKPPPQPQQQQRSLRHLGWFTVGCEVIRRELRTYVITELLLARCIQCRNDAPSSTVEAKEWCLVASARELKAFINALGDAMEPVTQALVEGLNFPLYHSVVLLLVFDLLHQLFLVEARAGTQRADAVGFARHSTTAIRADASRAQLVRRWIHHVVAPLYRDLAVEDQKTVLLVLSSDFVEEYLQESGERTRGSGNATQRQPSPPTAKETSVPAYTESDVHHAWQQWRQQGTAALLLPTPTSSKTEAAVLACVEQCIAENKRPLLHLSPSLRALPNATSTRDSRAEPTTFEGQRRDANTGSNSNSNGNGNGGGGGASWMEAGSALRSTLLHTIGGRAPSRRGQQTRNSSTALSSSSTITTTTGAPTPDPASLTEEERKSPLAGQASTEAASTIQRGRGLSVAMADAVAHSASLDTEEAIQLLGKEEAFLRRQLSRQLFTAQQHDFFASPAFQHALVDLYLAMRAEKRRKELVSFALDQLDLIFAFESRAEQLLHGHCRRELRQAWVDYGERQRLALHRLLQEEHEARIGVQAVAYADRATLLAAAQAEQKIWILQDEGRRGVALLEQDARDALSVAAATAHVELARRAVEAEEDAYWKAEEDEWARMEQEGGESGVGGVASSTAPQPVRSSGAQKAWKRSGDVDAAVAAVASSSLPAAALPVPAPSTQQDVEPTSVKEDEKESYLQTGLAHAATEVGTSNLFGTLSRWQTALRERVAPAPASRRAQQQQEDDDAENTDASHAAAPWRDSSIPPLPVPQSRVAAKTAPIGKAADVGKGSKEKDDWGWGSDYGGDDVVEVRPRKPAAHAHPHELPLTVPPVIPLTSRRILPLHGSANAAAADNATVPSCPLRHLREQPPSNKPTRVKRKGLAATLLAEGTSTTSTEEAAPPSHAGVARWHQLPPLQALPREQPQHTCPAQRTPRPSNTEEATPNPVRSILSAVEAAATETISKNREDPETSLSTDRSAEVTSAMEAQDSRITTTVTAQQKTAYSAASCPTDRWAGDGSGGKSIHGSGEEGVEAKLMNTEVEPAAVAAAAKKVDHVVVLEKEESNNDNVWGWSDEDDAAHNAAAAQPVVADEEEREEEQQTPLLTAPHGKSSPSRPSGEAPVDAMSGTTGPGHARSIPVNEAPLVEEEKPHSSGWFDADEGTFGSEIVPMQQAAAAAAAAPPHRPSAGGTELEDVQVQQLYMKELETREQLLNLV